MFLIRKKFWLTVLKLFMLAFVGGMILVQVPELRYDLGSREPVAIESPSQLADLRPRGSTFATVAGKADIERAFVYSTHGISYSYVLVKPYDRRLVVRSFENITKEWQQFDRFVGRLKPFRRMPFSRRIRSLFQKEFKVEIPADAYFLGRDDVPRPSAWQIGALIFASLLWAVLFYFFWFFSRSDTREEGVNKG